MPCHLSPFYFFNADAVPIILRWVSKCYNQLGGNADMHKSRYPCERCTYAPRAV